MANNGSNVANQIAAAVALGRLRGGGNTGGGYLPSFRNDLLGDPHAAMAAFRFNQQQQQAQHAAFKMAHPGGIKGLLGNHIVQGILNAVTTPQSVVTSTLGEIERGTSGRPTSAGDWWKQIYHPSQRLSGSDVLFGNPKKDLATTFVGQHTPHSAFVRAPLGFGADIATDPLTYVGIGAVSGGAKEATAQIAEAAGREVEQQAGRKAALEYARQAGKQLSQTALEKVTSAENARRIMDIHGAAQSAIDKVVKRGVNALTPEEVARFGTNEAGKQILKKGLEVHLPGMGERTFQLTKGGERLGTGGVLSKGQHLARYKIADTLLGHGEASGLGKLLPNAENRALARGGDLQSILTSRLRDTAQAETVAHTRAVEGMYNKAIKGYSDAEIQKGFDAINGSEEALAELKAAGKAGIVDNLDAVHRGVGQMLVDNGVLRRDQLLKGGTYTPHPLSKDIAEAMSYGKLWPGEDMPAHARGFFENQRTLYDTKSGLGGLGFDMPEAGVERVPFQAASRAEADQKASEILLNRLKDPNVGGEDGARWLAEHPYFEQMLSEGGAPLFAEPRAAMGQYARSAGRRIAQTHAGVKAYLAGYGTLRGAQFGLTDDEIQHLVEQHAVKADEAKAAQEVADMAHERVATAAEGAPSAPVAPAGAEVARAATEPPTGLLDNLPLPGLSEGEQGAAQAGAASSTEQMRQEAIAELRRRAGIPDITETPGMPDLTKARALQDEIRQFDKLNGPELDRVRGRLNEIPMERAAVQAGTMEPLDTTLGRTQGQIRELLNNRKDLTDALAQHQQLINEGMPERPLSEEVRAQAQHAAEQATPNQHDVMNAMEQLHTHPLDRAAILRGDVENVDHNVLNDVADRADEIARQRAHDEVIAGAQPAEERPISDFEKGLQDKIDQVDAQLKPLQEDLARHSANPNAANSKGAAIRGLKSEEQTLLARRDALMAQRSDLMQRLTNAGREARANVKPEQTVTPESALAEATNRLPSQANAPTRSLSQDRNAAAFKREMERDELGHGSQDLLYRRIDELTNATSATAPAVRHDAQAELQRSADQIREKWLTQANQLEAASTNQNLPDKLQATHDSMMSSQPIKSSGEAMHRELSFATDSQIDRVAHMTNDPIYAQHFDHQLQLKLDSLDKAQSAPLERSANEWRSALKDAQKSGDAHMEEIASLNLQAIDADAALRQAKIVADVTDRQVQRALESKDLHAQMSKLLIRNGEDYASFRSLAPGLLTPNEVSDQILQFERFQNPEEMGKLLRNWMKVVQYTKRFQIATPGFLIRNSFGGAFNNALADINWSSYGDLMKAWSKVKLGKELTGDEADLWDKVTSLTTPGQAISESGLGSPGAKLAGEGASLGQRLNPLSSRNAFIAGLAHGQGEVEFLNRGSLAWDVLKKGGSVDDAVAAMQKYHFNFRDLSSFDQKMKRVIPFWTYMSRNLPLQLEMLVSNPKWYARYEYIRRGTEALSTADPIVPAYFGETQAIRLPQQQNGGHLYMFPTLPMRDLNLLQAPLDALGVGGVQGSFGTRMDAALSQPLAQVTPLITGPIEWMTGREFYKDIPLNDNKAVPLSDLHVPSWLQGPISHLPGGYVKRDPGSGRYYVTQRDFYVLQKVMPLLAQYQRGGSNEPRFANARTEFMLRYWLGLQLRYDDAKTQQTEQYLRSREGVRLRGITKNLSQVGG